MIFLAQPHVVLHRSLTTATRYVSVEMMARYTLKQMALRHLPLSMKVLLEMSFNPIHTTKQPIR